MAHDYVIIGAGPAGLQLAAVLERGSGPGTFFTRFPRYRRLISINEVRTGNSPLSDEPELLFTKYSRRYFPHARRLRALPCRLRREDRGADRVRHRRNDFTDLPGAAAGGTPDITMSPAPSWADLDRLRARATLPVLLKGVLHPAHARLAVEHGAAGVIVSNHGGRQLDVAPATVDALPTVVDAVAGTVPHRALCLLIPRSRGTRPPPLPVLRLFVRGHDRVEDVTRSVTQLVLGTATVLHARRLRLAGDHFDRPAAAPAERCPRRHNAPEAPE